MGRLLLVSNRLPVTIGLAEGQLKVTPSAGGLATGLSGAHQESEGLWIGWPGDISRLDSRQQEELAAKLEAMRLSPIYLSSQEVAGFYEDFSNRVLWPLFHYLLDHLPLGAGGWEVYRQVNQRFAEAVARQYRKGDLIWVHDYHLCLVPGMLRALLPAARIGFFLHIPFPTSDVLQALPWRNALLEGLLGADLVGFHTFSYARHFGSALLRLLGVSPEVDRVQYRGREVRLGTFPMGIDAGSFSELAQSPRVLQLAGEIRRQFEGQRLLLGVDRLDYTKGLRRRMLALERLLEREPSLVGKLKLVQIAVPSRTSIEAYDEFRQEVDEVVGHLNGAHSTIGWAPVHYLYRGFSREELVAFYRAADLMLVTPLRDGMNLVSKEFVASRPDERGVLLLSELAGASAELGEAVLVNPYDVDELGQHILRALSMSEQEQRIRMRALRWRVFAGDVHQWVKSFLDALEETGARAEGRPRFTSPAELAELRGRILARPRLLLLDYDGTLVSFGNVPRLVGPDPSLLELLGRLAELPQTAVHVASGRDRETLEAWFGQLPLGLHAEHGAWSRGRPDQPWIRFGEIPREWKEKLRPILEVYSRRTPGSFLEEKSAALAWHYRMADPELGQLRANELTHLLRATFANAPLEVLQGEKVVEVRPHGVNKGLVVGPAMALAGPEATVVAVGDDRTDEDMFAALPPGGIAIRVGAEESRAPYRLEDVAAVRRFLWALLAEASAEEGLRPAPPGPSGG